MGNPEDESPKGLKKRGKKQNAAPLGNSGAEEVGHTPKEDQQTPEAKRLTEFPSQI